MSKGVLLMECARTGVAPATPAAASTPTRPATPAALALLLLTCLMAAAVLAPASFAASALAAEATSPSETPQRIVSLAPSNTEILFNLGLGPSIVGVTTACDYPAEASSIDKIGDYNINVEAVVAKQPDLVVAVSDLQAQVIDKLRELGLNVVAVNPTTIPEVFDAIQTIGDATGRSAAARELVAELEARMAAVKERVAATPESARPRVFVEIWNDPLMTAGHGTFVDDLVRAAGGINIFGSVSGWPQVSHESVITARPNVVILTSYNRDEVMARSHWRTVPALVTGQVYEVLPDLLVRPGPRLIDGLELLAQLFSEAR